MAKSNARESIRSLTIRIGDPPKRPASCQVCRYPLGAREDGVIPLVRCERCGLKYHEPCFWRVLPLDDWAEYVRWAMETNEDEEDQDEDEEEEDEQGFEIICAVCREKRGV